MLRSSKPLTFILIRHAETIKNRQRRHGGGDESLTTDAGLQLERQAQQLITHKPFALFCQPEERSQHSAQLLAKQTNSAPPTVIDDLRGINMGAVSGLSDVELAVRHPLVALSYMTWRHTHSTLRLPHIDGLESVEDFAVRSLRGLEKLLAGSNDNTVVLVGTTSGILMVHHLLEHDGELVRSKYHFYEQGFDKQAVWHLSPDSAPRKQ